MNDVVNGLFETLAGLFILLSIRRVWRDKKVRGVSVLHVAFFWLWGLWNVYFYPSLDQWWSTLGGVLVLTSNTVWVALLAYYSRWPGGRK